MIDTRNIVSFLAAPTVVCLPFQVSCWHRRCGPPILTRAGMELPVSSGRKQWIAKAGNDEPRLCPEVIGAVQSSYFQASPALTTGDHWQP